MNYTAILNISTVDVDNNTRNNTNTTPPLIENVCDICYFFRTLFFATMMMRWICHGFHRQDQLILLNNENIKLIRL